MTPEIAMSVGQWLENSGFGTLSVDIFVGQIPPDTNGLYVVRGGGVPNKYVPIDNNVVDIYAKNTSSQAAVTALEDIKRVIHRMYSTEVDNAYIYSFLVIGDITDVQRDAEYAKIYKMSVQVLYRNETLIS